ncbi:hypothetical protein Pjdr2_0796 [Paenibacillus sp. JDR-2]|nr:hypothetical protein Pjdr2_0796 [Paenibacillus sp. JDR-2]
MSRILLKRGSAFLALKLVRVGETFFIFRKGKMEIIYFFI